MVKFSCPRCICSYQADDEHIGKHIRCTNCGDLIPIARQDGRYVHSTRPMQRTSVEGARTEHLSRKESLTNRWERRPVASWAKFSFAVLLIVVICFAAFVAVKDRAKPSSGEAVESQSRQAKPENSSGDNARSSESTTPLQQSSQSSYNLFEQPQTLDPIVRDHPRKRPPVTLSAGDVEIDCESNPQEHSLPNGAQIVPDVQTSGHGELEASNGTAQDAFVDVVDVEKGLKVRQRFIRWGNSVTIDHLAPGAYRVVFATGCRWNDAVQQFERGAAYFQFGKNLEFEETSDSQKVRYDHHSITLNPVPNGNVRVIHLTKAEFQALSGSR